MADSHPVELGTAIHEAAHAVAGWSVGWQVTSLTIDPPYCGLRAPAWSADGWRRILVSLVGEMAACRHAGRPETHIDDCFDHYLDPVTRSELELDGNDLATALDVIGEVADPRAAVMAYETEASSFLDEHWPQIVRLATDLTIVRSMNQDACDRWRSLYAVAPGSTFGSTRQRKGSAGEEG